MQTFDYDPQYFNLDNTLAGGQVFRWRHQRDGWWVGVVEGQVVKLRQDGGTFTFGTFPNKDDYSLIERYFQLDTDLAAIQEVLCRDPFCAEAVTAFPGLRLCRQQPDECLLSFVASTANSVPQIAKGIEKFSAVYGEYIGETGGHKYYTFPSAATLAAADLDIMAQQTGLGWRGVNVTKVAKQLAEKPEGWLESLRQVKYVEAVHELTQFAGVGRKIADCVCLFSLDKSEAVPVDTHVWQLTKEYYLTQLTAKSLTDASYNAVVAAFRERFGPVAGWAQEYLFCAHFVAHWGGKSPLLLESVNHRFLEGLTVQVSVPTPQRTKTSSGKLLALTLLSLLLLGLPILSYPLGGDEAMFAIAAEMLMRGQHLYLDIWDLKPPAIYLLYAGLFSIGGVNAMLIWCFDLAWTLLTCFLIYLLGTRMYSSGVGLVAAFAYGTAYFPYDYANMAQTDSFMVLPIVAAIYFAYRSRDGHSGSWMFAAGLMLGFSFWLKYTGVVFAPIVVLVLLWPRVVSGGFFGKVLAGIAGFLLVATAFLAYIFFNGIWSGFIATLVANTGYNNYGFGGTFSQAVTRLVEGILLFHVGLWLLALVPLIQDLRSGKANFLSLKGNANLILWLWLALAFAALLIQQKLYPYQWIPMLAPLSLIAARGFFAVLEWPRWSDAIPRLNRQMLRPLLLALLLLIVGSRILKEDLILYPQFIAYSTGLISESEYALNFGSRTSGGSTYLDRISVAHTIVANTQPDQKILVWGYVPEIYWLANRQPASRFAFNYPLVAPWYPGEWKQEFMTTITANPPTYFVIVHDDYIPYQSGRQEDSFGQLKYVPGLTELLNRDYTEETRFNDMSLYRHK